MLHTSCTDEHISVIIFFALPLYITGHSKFLLLLILLAPLSPKKVHDLCRRRDAKIFRDGGVHYDSVFTLVHGLSYTQALIYGMSFPYIQTAKTNVV